MDNIITLTTGQKIEVLLQDEVSLDIDCSLFYIESGKKEIEEYVHKVSKKNLETIVDNARSEIENRIKDGVEEAKAKATASAQEIIDENILSMKTEVTDFIDHEVKPEINNAKSESVQAANLAAQSANQASQSATSATEAYNRFSPLLEDAKEVACGNIGDIKYTLRTTEPHGGVFCNGQILSKVQYPDLYQMLLEGKIEKISLSEYENQVLSGGICRFFAIDEKEKTIKVPTIISENSNTRAYVVCYTGKDTEIDITQEIELNNPFSLFDYKWSEYDINNPSWLLSNGVFHSGNVYVSAYNLLVKLYNGTESKNGLSVKQSTEAYGNSDFVINTSNKTFRLPIKVKLASGHAVVGNGMTLGLTNGSAESGLRHTLSSYPRLQGGENTIGLAVGVINNAPSSVFATDQMIGITQAPSKSGIETSSSGLKLYFYVGETIQDAGIINASGVLSALSNKLGFEDKELLAGLVMPDYSAGISVTYPVQATPFVAPKDGVYITCFVVNGTQNYLYINGKKTGYCQNIGGQYRDAGTFCIPLQKGDSVYWSVASTASTYTSVFYPFKE